MRTMPVMMSALLVVGAGVSSAGATPAVAATSTPLSISSQLGCVETAISAIHPSTDASGAGSGTISFRDDIAPGHGSRDEKIRAVTLAYTTDVPDMHAGDRARVCLSYMPKKDASPQGCDPATDPRGRRFVILDRVTGTVAQYYDGIHLCGGA